MAKEVKSIFLVHNTYTIKHIELHLFKFALKLMFRLLKVKKNFI